MVIRLLSLLILTSFISVKVEAQNIRGRRDNGGTIVLKRVITVKDDRKVFKSNNLILQDNDYEILALSYGDTLNFKVASDIEIDNYLVEYKANNDCEFYYNIWFGGSSITDCFNNHYRVDVKIGLEHKCNIVHLVKL